MATEQQRIANALQTMAGIEPSKANETEQQRIAAAVEALAQGGGGSTGGVMVVHATSHYDEEHDATYYTADKSFDEVVSFIENGGIPILIDDYGNVAQCTEISQDGLGDIGDIYFQHIHVEEDTIITRKYTYYVVPPFSIQNFIGYSEVEYSGSGGGEDPIG